MPSHSPIFVLLLLTACSTPSTPAPDGGGAAQAAVEAPADGDTGEAVVVPETPSPLPAPDEGQAAAPLCGNGRVDTLEVCEGIELATSIASCLDNGLGEGTAICTERCTLDVSGCEITDYCEGNGFYNDHSCDACELLGGHADPACAEHCGADGVCASWYDSAVAEWSCTLAGYGPDPDCGTCGNGIVEVGEFCDGEAFRTYLDILLNTCEVWGYQGGSLSCRDNCTPDFSACL